MHDNALTRTLLSHKRSARADTVSPLPGDRSADTTAQSGNVRAGRDAAGVRVLHRGKGRRALRRDSHPRNRWNGRLGAAGRGGQEDDRIGHRARFIDVLSASETVR